MITDGSALAIYPMWGQLYNERVEHLACPVLLMIFSSELTDVKRFPKSFMWELLRKGKAARHGFLKEYLDLDHKDVTTSITVVLELISG